MEGIARRLQARLAGLGIVIPVPAVCRVEGVLRAWIPDPDDPLCGTGEHGYTEAELAARMARKYAS